MQIWQYKFEEMLPASRTRQMFKIRLAFYKLANKIEGMARNVQAVREREKFKERTWNFSYTYRKKKADLYNS